MDQELERLIEESDDYTLEEALRIAKLHWALDYQRKDWGFDCASERQWKAFVEGLK